MATLVTGGVGFVGAGIVKELAARGHAVVSYDVLAPDALMTHFLGDLAERVTFVGGDILDTAGLDALRRDHAIDKVVHAAVFTVNRTDRETARSKEILDINLTGTGNLLELAREIGVQRFVYISSGAAYGLTRDPDQTYNEDDHPQPGNLYGITKLASEQLTSRYGQLHGFSVASLRVSTPYGPMERVTGHRDNMSTPYQWTGQMLRGRTDHPGHHRLRPGLHLPAGYRVGHRHRGRRSRTAPRPVQHHQRRAGDRSRDPTHPGRTVSGDTPRRDRSH